MVQILNLKVEAVTDHGFVLVARNVKLTFPDTVATIPLPKNAKCVEALLTQHPEIKIPWEKDNRGFERVHLCFTEARPLKKCESCYFKYTGDCDLPPNIKRCKLYYPR